MSASSQLINAKVSPKGQRSNAQNSQTGQKTISKNNSTNDQQCNFSQTNLPRSLQLDVPSQMMGRNDNQSEVQSLLQRAGERYKESISLGNPLEKVINHVRLFAKDELAKENRKKEISLRNEKLNETVRNRGGTQGEYLNSGTNSEGKYTYQSQGFYQPNEPNVVNHDSKYFRMKQNSNLQGKAIQIDQKKKRVNGHSSGFQSQSQTQANQKIPMIKEWFSQLSLDERILSLSSIDKFVTQQINRMQKKINKHGNGEFSLETRIIPHRQTATKTTSNDRSTQSAQLKIKQDLIFKSINVIIEKDSLSRKTKQVHEKELMDYIRITDTIDRYDTLTVSPALVADPEKFYLLVSNIVGTNFLKVPYNIKWDETKQFFVTVSPQWFNPKNYNSITAWIVYYLERALWMQYLCNVKGEIFNNNQIYDANLLGCPNSNLLANFFISPEGKLINLKNELLHYWNEIHVKSLIDPKILNDLEKELLQRTHKYLDSQNKTQTKFITGINRFSGGLDNFENIRLTSEENIKKSKQVLGVLQREQDPQVFLQNLCMISLDRMNNVEHNEMERILAEILIEKSKQNLISNMTSTNKKLQKKKLKKKMKQIMIQNEKNQLQSINNNDVKKCQQDDKIELEKGEEEKEELHSKVKPSETK